MNHFFLRWIILYPLECYETHLSQDTNTAHPSQIYLCPLRRKKYVHYKAGSSPPRYARQMSSRVLSNTNYLTGYFCCCHRDYKVPSKCKNHCEYRQWSQWLKQIRAGVGTHLFGCLLSRTLRPSKQWSLTSLCSDTWKWNPIHKDKLVYGWVHTYTENIGSIGDDQVLCGNFFTSSSTRY